MWKADPQTEARLWGVTRKRWLERFHVSGLGVAQQLTRGGSATRNVLSRRRGVPRDLASCFGTDAGQNVRTAPGPAALAISRDLLN